MGMGGYSGENQCVAELIYNEATSIYELSIVYTASDESFKNIWYNGDVSGISCDKATGQFVRTDDIVVESVTGVVMLPYQIMLAHSREVTNEQMAITVRW